MTKKERTIAEALIIITVAEDIHISLLAIRTTARRLIPAA
jgi:hypothetical protein